MQTTIHTFKFDISKPEEKEAFEALQKKMVGRHCMHTFGDYYDPSLDGQVVQLDTKNFFSNQWNATPGGRVFDYALEYQRWTKNLKRGHYLDITPEMKEIRRNTNVCGCCGYKERMEKGLKFCDQCLSSPYLKEKDLYLLRMLPVGLRFPKRAELTTDEAEYIVPLYKEAQRIRKKKDGVRERVKENYNTAVDKAWTKREGMLWVLDHEMTTDNVIFYDHRGTFCFGWRTPLTDEEVSALLDIITEFPFSYEIKRENGEKLEGVR